MYDKIKISIPEGINELLRKDALDFRILKPNGEINLNAFINTLIMNYYETFAADEEELRDGINKALSSVPERYSRAAFDEIIKTVAKRERGWYEDDRTVVISFKPTKQSESVIIYVENVLLHNESLSSFYRRLLISYARKNKTERERIIHKTTYDLLCKAIKKQLQVCISLDNGHIYNGTSLYAVAPAKDEMYNYVLAYSDKKSRTLRLAKIKTVSLLATKGEIPTENAQMFERQIRFGAQYPIYSLFEKIYLYRPTPTSIDGDIYTFECSANQILYYFERFGSEALILSPKKLGIFMRNYYYYALKKYRTVYGKD